MSGSKKKILLVFLSGLVLGGALCSFTIFYPVRGTSALEYRGSILRMTDPNAQLTSPLLAAEIGSEQAFPELTPAKDALTTVVNKAVSTGKVRNVSVYYRLMNSGRWFEINDATTYAPASLLKVFVMLAYYAEAEDADKPALLQKQIRFEGSKNPAQDMPGEVIPHFVDGKFYSVEDVIGQMIIYSDNDALNTLVDNFDADTTKEFNEIFADLKIPSPVDQKESSFNFLTVNQYAMVFRVLYSTTYLSPRYSQKALQLLSKAHYANGLVAGVPPNTTVAHKFGVTTDPASGGQSALPELHDCGIVYYPSHPYLLCVMTRGSDFATLQSLIKDLSAAAYQQTPAIFKTPAAVSK